MHYIQKISTLFNLIEFTLNLECINKRMYFKKILVGSLKHSDPKALLHV